MGKITVAIGDIHGCLTELKQLMTELKKHVDVVDRYVFLGDYVDRGKDSKGVIEYLMTLEGDNVFLRGNHEDMMLWQSPNFAHSGLLNGFTNWMINGGVQTLESYGSGPIQSVSEELIQQSRVIVPDAHFEWIMNTKLFFQDGQRTYVHAGIDRRKPITEQQPWVLTWIRDEFLNNVSPKGGYVVHGHTPLIGRVELRPNRCNLDSGCVFGGTLSAGIFDDRHAEPRKIINHKGKVIENV